MSETNNPKGLNYKESGVDIEAGNRLVKNIGAVVQQTNRTGVLTGLGGFGALFELDLEKYTHPVLVSGTDGVGTKLLLAKKMNRHSTIGIDLVAMCVNDVVVQGAEPLFFLDYFATGRLNVETASDVITGIAQGCKIANTALVGGETAEMPGLYQTHDYDLAGFCVGVVEKSKIIDGSSIKENDVVIGLGSSGPHSNGFSLIRMILDNTQKSLSDPFEDKSLGDYLLEPTRIYVTSLLNLCNQIPVRGICHITGGGLLENLPRILPQTAAAVIDSTKWTRNPIFDWLQQEGNIDQTEMYRTFNCGIGMVIIVAPEDVETSIMTLQGDGENAQVIGHIRQRGDASSAQIVIK